MLLLNITPCSKLIICFGFLLAIGFMKKALAGTGEIVIGEIRIQALSANLFRIEQKGPHGFEDRHTFTVIDRDWPGESFEIDKKGDQTILITSKCEITIPETSRSLQGIDIRLKNGKSEYLFNGLPALSFLPGPVSNDALWLLPDSPRLVPPEWGAIPPPEKFKQHPTSGWDTSNDAEDVYVFLLEPEHYARFRQDFLKLTGPVPMPPLYAFGLWDSRYHPYSEATALNTIQTYRDKEIPLDVFVVDTDWRVGASHGYGVNDSLFPDMKRFITKAHDQHVRLMYNDHPEPQEKTALAPAEIQYRWDGLTSLLQMGIDVWWYDRNWHTGLHEPMPGLSKEVWGMWLYHDITQAFRPQQRPLIMSNVDGIDNGIWNTPSHPAAHRFPVWWTGDQKSEWEFLERGVANGVNSGIYRLLPYVNEDLGGHTGGNPEPEQYVRWLQYGVFSPIARLHCTRGLVRYPWEYGAEAERIAAEYIRLRYRLLPTLYAAVRRAFEDGTPIMRRCDLEWPDEPEAKRDLQFLFGEDLLVAPIALGKTRDVPLPKGLLKTELGVDGLLGEYFDNRELQGDPALVRVDSTLNFVWGTKSPDAKIASDHFSARWTGRIGPFKESGLFNFKVIADDGVRIWIENKLVVDAWSDQAPTDYPIAFQVEAGQSYAIRIEFYENAGGAHLQLAQAVEVEQIFQAWIPPGNWSDAWTGKVHQGPKRLTLQPLLWQCPLFVRDGGIIFSLPQMQYTTERPWTDVIVDAFVPVQDKLSASRVLYEDDGISPDYQKGAYCKTAVVLSRESNLIQLNIDRKQGDYSGAIGSRNWVLRFHLPQGWQPQKLKVDGKALDINGPGQAVLITGVETSTDALPFAGPGSKPRSQAGAILEVNIDKQDTEQLFQISFELK